jgi:lipopolysaccharide transport system ATP-binding protein
MIHRITDNSATESSCSTHDGEKLVSVEAVSKKFCRNLKKSLWYAVQDIAAELNPFTRNRKLAVNHDSIPGKVLVGPDVWNRKSKAQLSNYLALRDQEFWAVDDISFELRRGECLGLIGRNGAGKTTLLRLLNGLIKPDKGRIEIRGKVSALIALGAGFNPILTGRENIYVNGSILGLPNREIDDRIEEIIDFAELRDFIDSPVQSYSSGMQVRLGYSIAASLKPDILLLDEVLAVGDAAFRMKCYNMLGQLLKHSAVVLVSHGMDQVAKVCTKVMVMRSGRMLHCGALGEGIRLYDSENTTRGDAEGAFEKWVSPITSAHFELSASACGYGENIELRISLISGPPLGRVNVQVQIYGDQGSIAAEGITATSLDGVDAPAGITRIQIHLGPLYLRRGAYTLSVLVLDSPRHVVFAWSFKKLWLEVVSDDWCCTAYRLPIVASSATSAR